MIAEIIAALILGGIALGMVLEPLVRRTPGAASALDDLIEPEETPKGQAIAALREIEFDRETGKLSDVDYDTLKSRYTARALEAMRAEEGVAAAGGADAVEAAIAARVQAIRTAESGEARMCPICGPRPEADAVFCSSCGNRLPTGVSCASCGAAMPPDGQFCEACGQKAA
ncbi:MAG: zinc ribbon domain-containing protein [Gemmatimonadales bacterium]